MSSPEARPPYFYKYRRCDEHTESWIATNQVYLSSPTAFNDPLDCKVHGSFEGSDDEIFSFLFTRKEWWQGARDKQTGKPLTKRARRQIIRRTIREKAFSPSSLSEYEAGLQKIVDGFGVLSLCTKGDSLTHFAYYGKDHRGYALQYDANDSFFQEVEAVTYEPQPSDVNLFTKSPEDFARLVLIRKAKDWEHEKEWRVIASSYGLVSVSVSALKGIIFGTRMEDKDKGAIRALNSQRKVPAKLYQATPTRDYKLEIKPIEQ